MHKVTVSDDPLERRIYEEAARDEETHLMLLYKELLEDMPPPPGWHKRKKVGRPSKRRPPGHQEEFGWKPMVLVLLLKTLHGLTYRETTSHLRANPELCARMMLPRAPSPKTIRTALERMPEAWLKKLNARVVGDTKGGRSAAPGKASQPG